MIPLNQSYKVAATLEENPKIQSIKFDFENYCLTKGDWNKHGRSYDTAMSVANVDFNNKIVAELGARDSMFSPYITNMCQKVYTSDIFLGWGDLGDLEYWTKLWKGYAIDEDKIQAEYQDMTSLTYADNSMDVVVSFSAIEHIPNDGDITAAKEMGRICKPGGVVIIGTDMCREHCWHHGGYFYDKESLFNRIIKPTGCSLVGDYDFGFDDCNIYHLNGLDFTGAIFTLRKKRV